MGIITYIDKNGNFAQLDNVLEKTWENRIEKIGNSYFEKKEIKEIKKEVKVEPVEEVKEEISEELLEKAKEFCKENKVRGYGLLKGQNLINKAIENGFKI